VLMNQV